MKISLGAFEDRWGVWLGETNKHTPPHEIWNNREDALERVRLLTDATEKQQELLLEAYRKRKEKYFVIMTPVFHAPGGFIHGTAE